MRTFIGIDPGASGAVAVLSDDGLLIEDAPYRDGEYDREAMRHIIAPYLAATVAIEDVHAMPKNGSIGCFKLGRGKGLWEGVAAGVGHTIVMVSSQRWKRAMLGVGKKTKADSLDAARNLFPAHASLFKRKKDDGRAEAALIAEYARRTLKAGV